MSLVRDPLALFTVGRECALTDWGEIKADDVRFSHIQDLFQCIGALHASTPIAVVSTHRDGGFFEAIVHDVSFRRTEYTPSFCTEIMYEVMVYTDLDVFHSYWLDRELQHCAHHGKQSRFNPFSLNDCTTPIRMRNRLYGEIPCYIAFSELVDAARKKRRDKLATLLMGTRAKKTSCSVQRFARHELAERQLFSLVKTFL